MTEDSSLDRKIPTKSQNIKKDLEFNGLSGVAEWFCP